MSSWLRIALLTVGLLGPGFLCESTTHPRLLAQDAAGKRPTVGTDHVYRYRGANGREVFTNAGHVAVAGEAVQPLTLPLLSSVDFAGASESQLQQLDRSVQRAHEELQTGQRCQAIRASLRVPATSILWREHLRELCVGVALFALALVVLSTWGGRLKALMPLAPLLACGYLAYATYERLDRRMGALREGLHACSSDLPEARGTDPGAVKERLASATDLQSKIDHAYAQRAALAESIMRER